jgi:hypothetical protein
LLLIVAAPSGGPLRVRAALRKKKGGAATPCLAKYLSGDDKSIMLIGCAFFASAKYRVPIPSDHHRIFRQYRAAGRKTSTGRFL